MRSISPKSAGKAAVIFFSILFFGSCSDRKRDNPLDPDNPRTRGKPVGLDVITLARTAQLSWTRLAIADEYAVLVYRKSAKESSYSVIGSVTNSDNFFLDPGLEYGLTYSYYITVRAGSYETPRSDIIQATPGPTFTWIADRTSGYVACLSHDLSRVFGKFGVFNFPYLVSASPGEGAAWLYSRFTDEIYKIDHQGELLAWASGLPNVTAMQVDTLQRTVWVAGTAPAQILRLDATGAVQVSITSAVQPTALAIDATAHSLFVIDAARKKVLSYSTHGALLAESVTFLAPSSLALDSRERTLWIADSIRIVQLRYDLSTTGTIVTGLTRASLVAIDQLRQTVWAVDLEPAGKPATLLRLSPSGAILSRLSQFGHPQCIAVNEFDGSCLVGDISYTDGGLYRVDAAGSKYEYIENWYAPYDIDIEYHGWQ